MSKQQLTHHSTFEPCSKHENGHFGWCLLCEIDHPRAKVAELEQEIAKLKEELHQEQLRADSMKFRIIELENEARNPEIAAAKDREFRNQKIQVVKW